MDENKEYRLSGGVFFSLLLEIANISSNKLKTGERGEYSQIKVLKELIRIVNPQYKKSEKGTTIKKMFQIIKIVKTKEVNLKFLDLMVGMIILIMGL